MTEFADRTHGMYEAAAGGTGNWTDGLSCSEKFIRILHQHLPHAFVNMDAYVLYAYHCADKHNHFTGEIIDGIPQYSANQADDEWLQMNVRNYLAKLTYLEILVRLSPGHYRWNANFEALTEDAVIKRYNELQIASLRRRAEGKKLYAEAEAEHRVTGNPDVRRES